MKNHQITEYQTVYYSSSPDKLNCTHWQTKPPKFKINGYSGNKMCSSHEVEMKIMCSQEQFG